MVNPGYRLTIDSEKGTLASFTFGIDHDLLIPGHTRLLLFKIEITPPFWRSLSSEAAHVNVAEELRRGRSYDYH